MSRCIPRAKGGGGVSLDQISEIFQYSPNKRKRIFIPCTKFTIMEKKKHAYTPIKKIRFEYIRISDGSLKVFYNFKRYYRFHKKGN